MSSSPFDIDWAPADRAAIGWRPEALAALVELAREHATAQLVILDRGRCVVNESFGCSDDSADDVYAVQKGFFRVLLARALEEGVISLDEPLSESLPAGWTKLAPEDEARLTPRHIVTMTTGMNDRHEPRGEVGLTWRYDNAAYNVLKHVIAARCGMTLQALTEAWLTDPLGMSATHWVERAQRLPDGRPLSGLLMSAMDMARLGQLVLCEGRGPGGASLFTPASIEAMFEPGSAANPAWCQLWWRNDQAHFMVPFSKRHFDGVPIPEGPADLRMAQGAGENRLYVWPSAGRVIARRGGPAFASDTKPRRSFDRELWQGVMACFD